MQIGIGWAVNNNGPDGNVPVNVTKPVINGNPIVGNVLTGTNGTWTSDTGILGYDYAWYRDGSPIAGATNNTYTTTLSDIGKNITLEVIAYDIDGPSTPAGSNIILCRDGQVPVNVIAPTISGSPLRGSTLTGTNGTWTSDTGITGYIYQWRRDGIDILGATSITYVTVLDDIGKSITLNVIATDLDGDSLPATSNTIVCTPKVPVNTVAPVISGTATIGQTLTSTTGTWTSDSAITYLYQWYRGATLISGATNNTYVLVTADVSYDITCKVAATNLDGTSSYVSSNAIFLFDVDYTPIISRATALSYTLPTLAQQKSQSFLLTNMKSIGVWSKLDVYYNFANNGSKEFATLNWKAPTLNQITMFNSISWNSNGFTGNGTNTYLDTNFQLINGVNYALNNASRYIYQRSASGSGIFDGNSLAATNTFRSGSSTAQRINQTATGVSPAFSYNLQNEMKSIHRTSATNITLYNGNTSENRTVASVALVSANHLLFRSQTTYGNHQISMFAAGASLITENANFLTAYDTYLNS